MPSEAAARKTRRPTNVEAEVASSQEAFLLECSRHRVLQPLEAHEAFTCCHVVMAIPSPGAAQDILVGDPLGLLSRMILGDCIWKCAG